MTQIVKCMVCRFGVYMTIKKDPQLDAPCPHGKKEMHHCQHAIAKSEEMAFAIKNGCTMKGAQDDAGN